MPRPPPSLIVAIDLGSSSVRSALFRENGARVVASSASRSYAIRYTADDGAELEPRALLRAARGCVRETLRYHKTKLANHSLGAVGGSAFWHGLLGLDGKGRPLTPVFTWADARSATDAARLRAEFSETEIQRRTGCMLRAPHWPAKLRWLRRTQPALFKRVRRWTSASDWIYRELFGVALTRPSMASGTGLYNLEAQAWDTALCRACGVRVEQLDPIGQFAVATKWIRGITIFPALGDGAASNLGSGADKRGQLAINLGTSAAARTILARAKFRPNKLPPGLFCYVVDQERLLIGGAISNAGNLHRWCLRELRFDNNRAAERALSRKAAAEDTLTVLPFWVQERALTWPTNLRGAIVELRPTTSAADVLRATTTSVFYRLAAIIEALGPSKEVIVSGGILHSPASLAILADSLGLDLQVCREMESSLRGAACHALEQLGFKVTPLRRGRTVKHRARLTSQHRQRRARQEELEERLD
ncbi:MAG: gluconokinase [Verrucomicrobiota bacterium]|nr:gluconokinase [Verrucomicrobiota bacterium]